MIEVLTAHPLLLILEGRVVLYLGVVRTPQVVQTLFRVLNLTVTGMMLYFRQKVVQPRPATKRSAEYMINNLIGKFFVDSKNEYASLKYISPEDDSPEVFLK
jgi:hypothetical protein